MLDLSKNRRGVSTVPADNTASWDSERTAGLEALLDLILK
jgi:hypothetical protein